MKITIKGPSEIRHRLRNFGVHMFSKYEVTLVEAESTEIIISGPQGCGKSVFARSLRERLEREMRGYGLNFVLRDEPLVYPVYLPASTVTIVTTNIYPEVL